MPLQAFDADYVSAYFAEVDRMDPPGTMAWYTDDASFRFANSEPAVGKDAISTVLAQFYDTITSMRHEVLGIWTAADSGVLEAHAHFTRKRDGKAFVLPAVSVLRVRDGLVHDFRFVMDASPLQQD